MKKIKFHESYIYCNYSLIRSSMKKFWNIDESWMYGYIYSYKNIYTILL